MTAHSDRHYDLSVSTDNIGTYIELTNSEDASDRVRSAYLSAESIVEIAFSYRQGQSQLEYAKRMLQQELEDTKTKCEELSKCPVCKSDLVIDKQQNNVTGNVLWTCVCSKDVSHASVAATTSEELSAVWAGFVSAWHSMHAAAEQEQSDADRSESSESVGE
jgi:hypothetical protein